MLDLFLQTRDHLVFVVITQVKVHDQIRLKVLQNLWRLQLDDLRLQINDLLLEVLAVPAQVLMIHSGRLDVQGNVVLCRFINAA